MNRFQALEVDLFIKALYEAYGYDFREYSRRHMFRRLLRYIEREDIASISLLQDKVLNKEGFFEQMIGYFSINVTSFFRNEGFYNKFRQEIVPYLKSFPKIKIWHAGCSTGQEVYSMAMLLHEAGLLQRCHLYGTDFNQEVLNLAKKGVYDRDVYHEFVVNYKKASGELPPETFFKIYDDRVEIKSFLKEYISFHQHNLTADHSLGEMTVVICRNVLIYFSKPLQNKVLEILDDSLKSGGVLCLGQQETLRQSGIECQYTADFESEKIFMKKY